MKIAILTFHRACNYGAFLQAYALQEYLNKLDNVQSFIFDYKCEIIDRGFRPIPPLLSDKIKLKGLIVTLVNYHNRKKSQKTFINARKKYFRIIEPNIKKDEIAKFANNYDVFIAGSDQIWNNDLNGNDTSFYLDFVKNPVKKYSYAASTGNIPKENQKIEELAEKLKEFQAVSVRESDLVSCLKQYYPGITQCIDPVFLFNGDDWRKFSCSINKKGYVLFFMIGNDRNMSSSYEFAKKYALAHHLKLVYISDSERWYKFRDADHFGIASPEEFVGLIENADCIVTNSFHGTAFSIILHKPFFVETNIDKNIRIINLLKMTGLEKRALFSGKPIESIDCEINWEQVDKKIEPLIQHSKNFLKTIANES